MQLSEDELSRYQFMADAAARMEGTLWSAAGVVQGAVVADIGCGPGTITALLAGVVGASGRVVAVDREPTAVEAAPCGRGAGRSGQRLGTARRGA